MDLFQELLLTVLIAAVFSFLVAKLISVATPATGGVSQLREIAGANSVVSAQRREIESEMRVQVSEGGVEKVDKFSGENELLEGVVTNLVGRTDCDSADGNAVDRVSEEKIVELLTVDDEIVKDVGSDDDSFEIPGAVGENTGIIGVEGDIVERKLDGFDDVDEENAMAGVSDKKIIVHLMVDDEIVEDIGGNHCSFENLGTIVVDNEEIGVEGDIRKVLGRNDPVIVDDLDKENASGEKFAEHLLLDDKIVKDVGSDSFKNTVAIGENLEKLGGEGDIRETLGTIDPVIDDEVTVEERSGGRKLDELDDVDEENVGPVVDVFASLGVNDEIVKSIGTESDIIMNLGSNDPVSNEVVVQEEIEGRKFEKIVEHEGVDIDSSKNSGANVARTENVGDVSDIMVNLGGCDNVVVTQDLEIKDESGVNQSSRIEDIEETVFIGYENNERAKADDAIISNLRTNEDNNLDNEKMKGFIDEDWEGIERSELEESFAAAANYFSSADKNVSKFDSDVKMELYGLNKVALEGPCCEPQPMAIKVSARAKWNAWQRLGNMSPEFAMEQYISLLSDKAPEWKEGKSSGDGSKVSSRVTETSPPDVGTYPENQLNPINESRELELNSTPDKVI